MAGSIKEIIVVVSIALALNYILFSFAMSGYLNVSCPVMSDTLDDSLNETFTVGNVVYTQDIGWGDIIDLAIGRCNGLPFVVVLLIEIPLLIGLLYAGRMMIGMT